MSAIANELLEKEIIRLREENRKINDQLNFVCKNREVIQKSYAALEKKYNEFVTNAAEINMGLLHVRKNDKGNPGVFVTYDAINSVNGTEIERQAAVLVEYNKESGRIQVFIYDRYSDDPINTYDIDTNLRETAAECRRRITECEAVLNEAYKEEYPEEFLTAMEEAELKDDIKQCEEYCKRFTKLTGEEA